jgi:hypothetical protein
MNPWKRAAWIGGFLVASLAVLVVAQSRDNARKMEHSADQVVYTCPMHPEVVSDKPGACPQCGMALEAKATPRVPVEAGPGSP